MISTLQVTYYKVIISLCIIGIFISLTGCSDDPSSPDNGETGSVTGIVTATNGVTPIQGAFVRVKTGQSDDEYDGPYDVTNIDGEFILDDVPAGVQILIATRGVFRAEIEVTVEPFENVEIPPMSLEPTTKLAFIPGSFDSMEDILQEDLGLELGDHLEQMDPSDLTSAEALFQYDMVFINCGSSVLSYLGTDSDMEPLRNFISSGGAIYISDLELPLLWYLFPDDFPSGEFESGGSGTVPADVVYQDLEDFIGQSSVEIIFDIGGWMGVHDSWMSDRPEVLLRKSGGEEPLAIVLKHGEGALIFTSFHNTAAPTFDQRAVLNYFVFGFGSPEAEAPLAPIAKRYYNQIAQPIMPDNNRVHRIDPALLEELINR